MLATLESGRVELEEVHRFPNQPVRLLDTLAWDLPRLFLEVRAAIAKAAERLRRDGAALDGIGVDAWGVDCALLDARGRLLANPVHYRDARTDGIIDRVAAYVPRERIFDATGVLFMQFNTLFQLAAELEADPRRFDAVSTMLFLPDLFHYLLTGRRVSERTIASTSQMWHAGRERWCAEVLEALGIPPRILPEVHPPGTIVGPLREDIARELGLDRPPPVIAGATHDTAAAVAAVPAADAPPAPGETWGYLSSGTWSLMGVELPQPLISREALAAGFTNEGGVGSSIRFLRIIMGLWLVQECRRDWEREGRSLDYAALADLAEREPPLCSIVVPDDPIFFQAGGMSGRIREFCRRSGQAPPESEGALVRCALESLALAYRDCAEALHRLTGKRIARLHIVGGGSKNRLLDQLTADALGVETLAGPAEATALGNALMQAVATGALSSIAELRRVVRDSTPAEAFAPRREHAREWERAYERYQELKRSRGTR